jgi:cobalamin transport system ATP-binding protein
VTPLLVDRLRVELDGAVVIDGLTLEVGGGEWVGIIGPNGAGKTTLLRAIASLVPFRGSIRLFGDEVASLGRREVARRVALVPQAPIIPSDMTVLEYVVIGRTPHLGYTGAPEARDVDVCRAALGRLDVAQLADRRLGSLSGGERQRAVLARAMAQDARLILLDEPTTALDVGAQQQVLELVAGLRESRALTVLSAMHDLTVAGQYPDRILLIDGGREAVSGSPAEVLTEETIARHYGASVRVITDGGTIAVVPLRPEVETEERIGP